MTAAVFTAARAASEPCGERRAPVEKEAGEFWVDRFVRDHTCGERGAQKGGVLGPALSVRLFAGHALPTVKSPIPELLSEGGSKSCSRLTITLGGRGFHAVARLWQAGKRAVKSDRVLGCSRAPRRLRATRSPGPHQSEAP